MNKFRGSNRLTEIMIEGLEQQQKQINESKIKDAKSLSEKKIKIAEGLVT